MSEVTNIRRLFLEPQPTYSVEEASALLGEDLDLRGWMEVGEIEGLRTKDGLVVPWDELVSFAMDFWSQEVVEKVLGEDVARVIPELLQLADLEVRIPRMQVVTLERLADVDGETVSAVVARELRDLVSLHSEWLSVEVTGFAEAFHWPILVDADA